MATIVFEMDSGCKISIPFQSSLWSELLVKPFGSGEVAVYEWTDDLGYQQRQLVVLGKVVSASVVP